MHRLFFTLALLAAVFCTSISTAQNEFEAPAGIKIERDLAFLGPDREEKLDLYRPEKNETGQTLPAVVIIHGGGWVNGDKGRKREFVTGTTLAKAGYLAVSVKMPCGGCERILKSLVSIVRTSVSSAARPAGT